MDIPDGVTDEGKSLLAAGVEMVGRTGAKSFRSVTAKRKSL
jgi:hypothetical protein